MQSSDTFTAANRANWDERADSHMHDRSGIYPIERLLRGQSLLTPIETLALGDISGLRIAHFQSHIGTDTISLKRLGAKEVVGIDFSARSISNARTLAEKAGIDARFVQGEVYEAPEKLGGDYDIVFTTWGTICWLADLDRWAAAIAGCLRAGGKLYFADAHPTTFRLEIRDGCLFVALPVDVPRDAPLSFDNERSYAGDDRTFANRRTYEWVHPASRVINALLGANLRIVAVQEHEAIPWQLLPNLERHEDGLFRWPDGSSGLPLSWSVEAMKD